MKFSWLALSGLLLLGGCASAPAPSPAPAPRVQASPAVEPIDQRETELLAASNNGDDLAKRARELVKLAGALGESVAAKPLRKHAYDFAKLAKERGTNDPFADLILSQISPDGSMVKIQFSANPRADALVHQGELAYGKGDYDNALDCYRQALELDPTCWNAALFAGDVFFAKKDYAEAIPWYEKAIAVDPTREPPHRYRADALVRLGRADEAGDGYIRAVVCAPTNPIAQQSLAGWASLRGMKLQPVDSSFIKGRVGIQDGKAQIYMGPDNINWIALAYLGSRAKYLDDHNLLGRPYRQSLAEESEAMHAVIEIAQELSGNTPDDDTLKAHRQALDNLRKIDRDGLLEAHILLNRATVDLMQDYPDYLKTHADDLARYIAKYCLLPQ